MTTERTDVRSPASGRGAPALARLRSLWAGELAARRFAPVSRGVSRFESAIGILCLSGLIIVPDYQVLARTIPALPLPLWTYDVATLFLVWLAMIGAAMAERAKTPPVVTILTDKLPVRAQGALSLLGAAISIVMFLAIAYDAALHIPEQWGFGVGDLNIPLALYNIALPIGAALIALHLVSRLRSAARLLAGGKGEQLKRDDAA